MIRINSRFVRQAIVAFALTVGVSTVAFAQDANTTNASTASATQTSNSLEAFLLATCAYCNGGGRVAL
jgi:hypothetical protein